MDVAVRYFGVTGLEKTLITMVNPVAVCDHGEGGVRYRLGIFARDGCEVKGKMRPAFEIFD